MERVQCRARKMVKGLEHLTYEELLRVGLAQLGEEKTEEDFTNVYKCRVRAVKEKESGFSQWCSVKGQEAMDTN